MDEEGGGREIAAVGESREERRSWRQNWVFPARALTSDLDEEPRGRRRRGIKMQYHYINNFL